MNYPVKILSQLRPILKGFRKARHLTQADLAKKLGITQQSYAQLEANPASASIERLFKVLQLLEVDLVLSDNFEKKEEKKIEQPTKILKSNQANVAVEKISPNYSSQPVHFKSSTPLDTSALKALMGSSSFDFNRGAEVDKYKLAGLGLDDSMKSVADMAKISGISSASDLANKTFAADMAKISGISSASELVGRTLAADTAKISGLTSASGLESKALAIDFAKVPGVTSSINDLVNQQIEKHALASAAFDHIKKEKW